MFNVWCKDKELDLVTKVGIFKDTEKQCRKYFKKFYSRRYKLLNIAPYINKIS